MDHQITVALLNTERQHFANLTWWPDRPYVRNGGFLPKYFEITVLGGADRPNVTLGFTVPEWWPQCIKLTVESQSLGVPVDGTELPAAGIEISQWPYIATDAFAQCIKEVDGEIQIQAGIPIITSPELGRVVVGNQRANVRMTEDRLNKVAEIYSSSPQRGLKALQEYFKVTKSTAARYARQAREAGLIEDRRRNKTS